MNAPRQVRVVIADDDALIRDALRAVLNAEPDLEVVAAAGDTAEAIALVEQREPDVAVLDLRMAGGGGVAAAREIRRRVPAVRLVALSAYSDTASQEAMALTGVDAYLVKGVPNTHIVSTVRRLAAPS
ncbi:Response regulator receiver domain-containing protein [Amycolatopsis marina]|uniref:Response regulator receiver domain-containing protein n=1 Tax=Amycolatopsis marina TaxID=490629 RepID=A0A1I1A3T8_9PSEU|nr:response regulator transcription factor [Amycolatopsis marina]SFB32615.1 Response regulator receiver domain-containing protein [Amycolatopsis marina]